MSEFVNISETTRKELCFLKEKTGIGESAVLRAPRDIKPAGLTTHMLRHWLDGTMRRARRQHLNFVLNRWRTIWREGDYYVAIPDGFAEELRAQRQRTGIGPKAMLDGAACPPAGLTSAIVQSWISGAQKRGRKAFLNWVLTHWQSLPDAVRAKAKPRSKKKPEKPPRVPLNAGTVMYLRALKQNTGVSPLRLLRETQHVPPGLSSHIIENWLSRRSQSARADHLKFVRESWEALHQHDFITLTDGDIVRLQDLIKKSGVGPRGLLRGNRDTIPDELSSLVVRSWLTGSAKKARRDHFAFVIELLEQRLESGMERIKLTDERILALEAERERTGVEVAALMRSLRGAPGAPKAHSVYHWLSRITATAKRHEYEAVLTAWQRLPDLKLPDPAALGVDAFEIAYGKIVLSETIRESLRRFQETSGKGAVAILRDAEARGRSIPAGLKPQMIFQWLNGTTKSVPPDYLCFVADVWESYGAQKVSWIELGEDERDRLVSFREAGLVPSRLFKNANDKPADLTPAMITRWLQDKAARVREDHWLWASKRCEELSRADDRRVPITAKTITDLKHMRDESGISQSELFEAATDKPEGLSPATVTAWINGNVATGRKDWLDWVLRAWKEEIAANARTREKP